MYELSCLTLSSLRLTHVVFRALPNSEMSDDEIAEFSQMTDEEFQEYLEHLEQEQQEQQEQQNYKAATTSYSAYTAYMSSNAGNRRHLYTDMPALCAICDQNFDRYDNYQDAEKEEEEAYDEMKELFESKFCFENGSGSYTGMTCGNDGRSIELGLFNDEDCLYLSEYQNAYNMFQDDGDGDEDIYLYMTAVYDMAKNPFSCQRGGVVQYDGGNVSTTADVCLLWVDMSSTYLLILILQLLFSSSCHCRNLVRPAKPLLRNPFPRLTARPPTTTTTTTTAITRPRSLPVMT